MGQPLVVNIPHTLGKDEAIRRMNSGFASASSNIPILQVEEQTWSDGRLAFKIAALGQSASGTADVDDTNVHIEIMLPWLMRESPSLFKARSKLELRSCWKRSRRQRRYTRLRTALDHFAKSSRHG